jgi:hypothetical protein
LLEKNNPNILNMRDSLAVGELKTIKQQVLRPAKAGNRVSEVATIRVEVVNRATFGKLRNFVTIACS